MDKEIVGYGESSRDHATATSNHYVQVSTRPVEGGADVVVEAKPPYHVAAVEREGTVRVRIDRVPRIGERVMVRGELVQVADVRYDQRGALWVMDEDTRAWRRWRS